MSKTKQVFYHQPIHWTYSRYRAMLRLDGKPFAVVTPDGMNALSKADQKKLLDALNGTCTSWIQISYTKKRRSTRKSA